MANETNISEVTAEVEETSKNSLVEEISEAITSDTSVTSETADASDEVAARNLRKERTGIVVSNKMQKTIVVKIEESVTHSKYSKIIKRSIKFKAHDEKNECDIGDKVLIMETRPLSKDKRWRLVEILEKVK